MQCTPAQAAPFKATLTSFDRIRFSELWPPHVVVKARDSLSLSPNPVVCCGLDIKCAPVSHSSARPFLDKACTLPFVDQESVRLSVKCTCAAQAGVYVRLCIKRTSIHLPDESPRHRELEAGAQVVGGLGGSWSGHARARPLHQLQTQ